MPLGRARPSAAVRGCEDSPLCLQQHVPCSLTISHIFLTGPDVQNDDDECCDYDDGDDDDNDMVLMIVVMMVFNDDAHDDNGVDANAGDDDGDGEDDTDVLT